MLSALTQTFGGDFMASDVGSAGGQEKLIARVKNILMTPKTEWPVIAAEPSSVADIYTKYLIILAAIPAIAGFIKGTLIGYTVPFTGLTFRDSIGGGLSSAIAQYIMTLVVIYVVALIADALAPTFNGKKDKTQALKTVAYANTAGLVAGVGVIVPAIGWLIGLVGAIYSIYLFYLGAPVTMQVAKDKAAVYTAAVAVVTIVLMIVLGAVIASLGIRNPMAMGALGGGSVTNTANVDVDPNSALGQLAAFGQRMEQAGQQLEQAEQSGDAQAQQQALNNLFGAALGGNAGTEALSPEQMQAFVPETLAGLPRTDLSTERNAMFGIQVAQATADYSDGAGRDLRLEIVDMGGAAGLTALAGWASIEQDRQTDTGYERTSRANGQIIHEEWDREANSGEYTVIVGNRFSVKAEGQATMDQLKAAVASVDLARLTQMGVAR
jgi:hypothetical protein